MATSFGPRLGHHVTMKIQEIEYLYYCRPMMAQVGAETSRLLIRLFKHMNTLCRQMVGFFNVKPLGFQV